MRRRLALLSIAIVCSTIVLLIPSCADSLFYRPSQTVWAEASAYHEAAEDVWFESGDGTRLHGWWLPARGDARGTVVYCHGNHANVTLHARYVSWLPEHGFSVLVFDYRGYGRSEGSPTRAGTVADSIAALDFALARDPDRTIVFGHSLGGSLAIVAAAERPAVRAVVAEATFPSYRSIARSQAALLSFAVPLLISDGHDAAPALPRIPPRPLLVIHGARDRVVPLELGIELFMLAAEPKTLHVAPKSSHMTPWREERGEFEAMLVSFFTDALAR